MDTVSIELTDDMTLGALRGIAQSVGKRLVVAFEDGARARPAAPARASAAPAASFPSVPSDEKPRRRKVTPAGRAALARNLAKARAVQAANRAAQAAAESKKAAAARPAPKPAKK